MSERRLKLIKLPNPFRPKVVGGAGVGVGVEVVVRTAEESKATVEVKLVVLI